MSNCCPPTFVFTSPPPPCPKQHYKKGKSRRCSAQGPKKKTVCVEMNGSNQCGNNGDKKKSFMEDVWKAMTPEMLNKLVDILVQDFNMSRAEACAFIKQQKDQSKQSQMAASGKCPCTADMVPAIPNMDVRNSMIREFLEVTACKLSDYMAMILCARRTRRQKVMNQLMYDYMNSFFGVQDGDKIATVTEFLADKLSLWLENIFEYDMCADVQNEEEAKKDQDNGEVKSEKEKADEEKEPEAAAEEAPPAEAEEE